MSPSTSSRVRTTSRTRRPTIPVKARLMWGGAWMNRVRMPMEDARSLSMFLKERVSGPAASAMKFSVEAPAATACFATSSA